MGKKPKPITKVSRVRERENRQVGESKIKRTNLLEREKVKER